MRPGKVFFGLILILFSIISLHNQDLLYTQEQSNQARVDSTSVDSTGESQIKKVSSDSASQNVPPVETFSGEIILEEIKIEAVIETPSVAIVPKRVNPEFGKMEFLDRSFENELKAIPSKPMLIEEELKEVDKIQKRKTQNSKSEKEKNQKKK